MNNRKQNKKRERRVNRICKNKKAKKMISQKFQRERKKPHNPHNNSLTIRPTSSKNLKKFLIRLRPRINTGSLSLPRMFKCTMNRNNRSQLS